MATAKTTAPSPKDQQLQISLVSGETIGPFPATTANGLKSLFLAYDKFLKGEKQGRFRFNVSPISGSPETDISLDFGKVLAITTTSK